jgi:preprotein translocase subunit YajC
LIAQANGGGSTFLISLVLMVGVFYFLLIRPQQRRVRQQRTLMESLEVGDDILTIGGLFGTIRAIDDDALTVEIAPGTTVRLLRSAVARKIVPEDLSEREDEETSGSS